MIVPVDPYRNQRAHIQYTWEGQASGPPPSMELLKDIAEITGRVLGIPAPEPREKTQPLSGVQQRQRPTDLLLVA